MCMISLPIEKVSQTKIFIGLNSTKTRQITIYSNFVANHSDGNAMIIPVPNPKTVNFHNISHIKNFFKNVDKSFVLIRPNLTLSFNSSISYNAKKESMSRLEIIDVGSYRVSLAPSFNDLERINNDVFILSDGLKEKLRTDYREDFWGFIVFVLAKDSKEYHPFAFSHDIINNAIYIPTKHYHDNSMSTDYRERISSIDSRINPYGPGEILRNPYMLKNGNIGEVLIKHDDNFSDDWSHNIYLFNCGNSGSKSETLKKMLNNDEHYKWDNYLYWNRRMIDFDLTNCDNFEKYKIDGYHPNIDLMIPVM